MNNKKRMRPRLKVFDAFSSGESLRPGYAYLIRSRVRMPELYPLLGELLFNSLVEYNEGETPSTPPNVIGIFIDDHSDNLVNYLGDPDRYAGRRDIILTREFGKELLVKDRKDMVAAWLDTFGTFQDSGADLWPLVKKGRPPKPKWWAKSVAGSGNPMPFMRFFRQVQDLTSNAAANLFLLNSLSNLYRNLELAESAAFLKKMLDESIWRIDTDPDKPGLCFKAGLFFAVLQVGVLTDNEESYLESFFDGIIEVKPCTLEAAHDSPVKVVAVHVKTLPEIVRAVRPFVYLPAWQFKIKKKDGGIDRKGWNVDRKYKHKYIFTRFTSKDECVAEKPSGNNAST